MAKYLVIVESPAKVKTIKKFLGANYEVAASNGHVRDLPKSQLGIDVEHDYEPKYITIRGKGGILANLRKEVKKAEKIYLATDPDREGEAISWHLMEALKLSGKKVYRITFNEITKNAVKESLKHAREINMDLVDAQQTRRILDRMVGYRISPLLWAKVKRGLSAGRVQSVALRIICDREDEINAFIPEEYWTLDASFAIPGEKKLLKAKYYGQGDQKTVLKSEAEVNAVKKDCEGAAFAVSDVKRGERIKKAPLPFTTSTLQQEASKVLNFSTQKTMRLAQQLYEGVDIKGNGTVGVITYLRTDSTRVSEEAEKMAKDYITEQYGEEYAGEGTAKKGGPKIQDAHEAIRPTDLSRTPLELKDSLTRDQLRLYQLIWKRFVASRMTPAKYETTSVKIDGGGHRFTVAASKVIFDGFMSVYTMDDEEKEEKNTLAKSIDENTRLNFNSFEEVQHFTQPPAHYTEASLVRALEELGIGRPSTYAPTITTILARRYVAKENKNLYVTELGEVVNNMMKEAFPTIVDVNFTANMEALLDGVSEGTVDWKTIVSNFYPDLDQAVKDAEINLDKVKIGDEESDEECELCGRRMVIKYGPHGRFLACPGFPECRNTKPYYEKIGVACPKCGKDIVMKKTQKGRRYYGCIDNPDCDFMVWQKPSAEKCPVCGSVMLEKGNKLVCSREGCGYHTEKK
ncbi:MAG: type I DNA topoisomerase [Lachnospiraceae bacterium]|nr:type I DNA topoisomerase [Lachnospiraceae bacterium]